MSQVTMMLGLVLLSGVFFVGPKERPRVFITDSQSWEISGGVGGGDVVTGSAKGGARPQTAEIIKTFGERCPNAIVTNQKEKADYVVLLDHEGGKSLVLKDNKYAIFNKDGDAIKSGSTRSLGNAVKEACTMMMANWEARTTNSSQTSAEVESKKN